MNKPKILMVGDASFLSTGYATEINHILTHLHGSGKYEVAELGCEAPFDDPRQLSVPWTFYNNSPRPHEQAEFASKLTNIFGEFRFNEVCLDFKPDYVINLGDHWMVEYVERSPFRHCFRWLHRATCDSIPQPANWISTYIDCDLVLTHSLWGKQVLEIQGGGEIALGGTPGFGVDTDLFRPMDKREVRVSLGMDEDSFIVGFVGRNQARKLIPDLINGFREYLFSSPPDLAYRSFLYLGTAWPDSGFDIPDIISNCGISHKILFTYLCENCGKFFPAFFKDAVTNCEFCQKLSARTPTTHHGLSREQLAVVYNTFDVYVQYATNEGFGAPVIEAASCGVPVMGIDYSATGDIVRRVNGTPIMPLKLQTQVEFGLKRAVSDEDALVHYLTEFAQLHEYERVKLSVAARQGVKEKFTWDIVCKTYEESIDSVKPLTWEEGWGSPSRVFTPRLTDYSQMGNEEFARWAISEILGQPEKINTYLSLRLVRDLTVGFKKASISGVSYINENCALGLNNGHITFNRENCVREFLNIREEFNQWESIRCK